MGQKHIGGQGLGCQDELDGEFCPTQAEVRAELCVQL